MCLSVRNFERFSLTIARWFVTLLIQRSNPGNYTTARDVTALLAGEPWTRALGTAPRRAESAVWRQPACTVAAYRDRYGIVGARPLGTTPDSTAQKLDASRARVALEAAERLAAQSSGSERPKPTLTTRAMQSVI